MGLTRKVFSLYNGERSYESRLGMQEGIAIELYWYLVEQRKISAFTSIFTITGSCFERFSLGGGNAEGIPLGPFTEGKPLIQPERMLVWATYNPGYDLSQPLYKTNPVFDAIKAAYSPGEPVPSPWDHRVESKKRPPPSKATIKKVAFIGDTQGDSKKAFETSGVPAEVSATSSLLVIDGATLTETRLADARVRVDETLKRHGTVFIWASPENLDRVNKRLPNPVSLITMKATSLYADREASETAPIALADRSFRINPIRIF